MTLPVDSRDSLGRDALAVQTRQKAQGSMDCHFWLVVADALQQRCDEIQRLRAELSTNDGVIARWHKRATDAQLSLTARAWQPIETVPKGKRVLVAYDYHLTQGIEIKECVIGHGFTWPSNAYTATHWMPLPEAP